jgi:hypothetical protein
VAPLLLHVHVERVDLARIVVVHPGTEDAVRAKLTSMLVLNDVVQVILARAEEGEGSDRLALQQPARDGSQGAIRVARHLVEDDLHILASHAALLLPRSHFGVLGDL